MGVVMEVSAHGARPDQDLEGLAAGGDRLASAAAIVRLGWAAVNGALARFLPPQLIQPHWVIRLGMPGGQFQ